MFVMAIMMFVCTPAHSRFEGGTGFEMNKGKQIFLFPHTAIIRPKSEKSGLVFHSVSPSHRIRHAEAFQDIGCFDEGKGTRVLPI